MKYQVQENCLTIFLPHELDHHNAEEIRRESDHLIIRNHIRYIIFDFAETDFMDSSGIGMILFPLKRSKRSHATVPKLPEIINCPVLLSAPDAMTSTILIELS